MSVERADAARINNVTAHHMLAESPSLFDQSGSASDYAEANLYPFLLEMEKESLRSTSSPFRL